METTTFLDKLANELVTKHQHQFSSFVVVLPNKRARLFLLEALKQTSDQTFFAPEIISIEDLIGKMSKVYVLNNVELLLEFYEVYKSITPLAEQQDFEQFGNWRSEEHTSELQSRENLVCRLLLEKKKKKESAIKS